MVTQVAVIGCGPSGMFFLHALALRRRRLEEEGNAAAIAALPSVTVFERASSPGGLWRSDRNAGPGRDDGGAESPSDGAEVGMYEGLWTNGAKECIEFFDYTFDDHFKHPMSMYMPRALILEYMLARCTRDNPTFFGDVKFDTTVKSVTYREDLGQFVVQTTDREGDDVTESSFDKCIWACGYNGTPIVPDAVSEALTLGKFKGTLMHSSEAGPNFDRLVRGKKILVIGDSYSAEDLILQAIKLGVEGVCVCSRSDNGIASYTGSWPRDCVDIYYAYEPTGVTDDGRGIIMSKGAREVVLHDIGTVIFCTGFTPNVDMLHPSLRPSFEGPFFPDCEMPKEFKMPKNPLTKELGDVPIGKIRTPYVQHDIYRGQLIANPNMMFFLERIDAPIIDLDVTAWMLLAQVMGDLPLPSVEEMEKFNFETVLEVMKDPFSRGEFEENFKERWNSIGGDDHWSYDMLDKRSRQMTEKYHDLQYRILARDMVDANYPLRIGTYSKLNKKGKALTAFITACGYARYELEEGSDADWRTFRDCDPSKCYSIMTGTKAVPLKCRWLDLDSHTADGIVDTSTIARGNSPTIVTEFQLFGRKFRTKSNFA